MLFSKVLEFLKSEHKVSMLTLKLSTAKTAKHFQELLWDGTIKSFDILKLIWVMRI